ncbi:hypothetical protein Tco_0697734 [Tanacetum coccineum]
MERDGMRWQCGHDDYRGKKVFWNTGSKLLLMAMRLLVLKVSKVRAITATRGHFARKCKPKKSDNKNMEISEGVCLCKHLPFTTLVSCDGLGGHDWSDQAKKGLIICTLPTQGTRSIISTISISPEGFLPSILLLVVIIVTVVIVVVMVILVVVVVAIIGVVIVVTIIGVVVVVMIIGVVVLLMVMVMATSQFEALSGNIPSILLDSRLSVGMLYSNRFGKEFRPGQASSLRASEAKFTFACASRATTILSATSCRMAPSQAVLQNVDSGGGVVDLNSDEDPTDEDGDIRMGDSTGSQL